MIADRLGSLADLWTNSSLMSASGRKADVKSSEIHEYEGPLSARSGHSHQAKRNPAEAGSATQSADHVLVVIVFLVIILVVVIVVGRAAFVV